MNFTGGQQMKPEIKAHHLLSIVKSKAKMWEYDVPEAHHIPITESLDKLFTLSIALLGDVAAEINRGHENTDSFMELEKELKFSADFFNSFYETRILETLSSKLRLLASAAYYLCDMPGNAKVLADSIEYDELEIQNEGLSVLLLWVLQGNISQPEILDTYAEDYVHYQSVFTTFYREGNPETILQRIDDLREKVYTDGTEEQLLLGDIFAAVTRKKIKNASIYVLPGYTGIDIMQWKPTLVKQNFIQEFWPAQHLLGKIGVLQGESAVVQMPTSAGKTKSTELLLRSAFLSNRTNFAIIVAPFRALCHEIANSLQDSFRGEPIGVDVLSDVLQNDYDVFTLQALHNKPRILIVTPEKLLYVLRHHPEIADYLKLIIFDEGHQFDTGKRGVTYELLLTSLKNLIPSDAQKVLISAVIPNAEKIGIWLNGKDTVAKGNTLTPTSKSIGFASWKDPLGQIKYVKNAEDIFSVPQVLEPRSLSLKGRERSERNFPEKDKGQDIALFLSLKLCAKGGTAIFCGRKDTAINICKRVSEIVDRGYPVENLQAISNNEELLSLSILCEQNLGAESSEAKSARIGVLAHHNNVPHGIRLAIEYAMREDKARIVVCTSTLAQGVNLPIRYLIVTSVYQGRDLIKVRDFHNLIGRAGRAGKHVEGSILFSETDIYDEKSNKHKKWRWENAQILLDENRSENCASSLLTILQPIQDIHKKLHITFGGGIESFEEIIDAYISNRTQELAKDISKKFEEHGSNFDSVFAQLFQKNQLLESVENFLLAHWEYINEDTSTHLGAELAKQTLAFHLADDEKKMQIIKIFHLLSSNIAKNIPEPARKETFGKTLYGINNAKRIEVWVNNNKDTLADAMHIETFVEIIWPLFCDVVESNVHNELFNKFDPPDARKDILLGWLSGDSFAELLTLIETRNVRKIYGGQRRAFTIEDVVDICENTFAFQGMLFVGAIIGFLSTFDNLNQSAKEMFLIFQKRVKYGLSSISSINVYELGFSDRFLAQKIASILQNQSLSKRHILHMIRNPDILLLIQALHMPSYYQMKLQTLLEQ